MVKPSKGHRESVKRKCCGDQDDTSDDNVILIENPAPSVGTPVVVGKKPKSGRKKGKQEAEAGSTSKTAGNQGEPTRGKKREHGEDEDHKEPITETEVKKVKKLTDREEVIASYLKLVAAVEKETVKRELENLIKSDEKKTTGFVTMGLDYMFTWLAYFILTLGCLLLPTPILSPQLQQLPHFPKQLLSLHLPLPLPPLSSTLPVVQIPTSTALLAANPMPWSRS